MKRRMFIAGLGSAAAWPVVARGQTYPTKPVRIVVPAAAGGVTDITARVIGQWLSERLGQQFFIENRPGGATNIGTEIVVRAPADGSTLLVVGSNAAINATLFERLSFNFISDIAPVANIVRGPQVMQVNPSLPAKTVPEFIAYAKANPGRIAMGTGGNGSVAHVAGELFNMMTGVNMVHVPYRGAAPAVSDLLGGQIQVTFTDMATSIGFIRAGTLRALAVGTAARSATLPDIPTVGEFVPGFEASQWNGIFVRVNTPSEIIQNLNAQINAGLADAKVSSRFADLGLIVVPGSPADFRKLVADETEKWGKVIRAANIKPE